MNITQKSSRVNRVVPYAVARGRGGEGLRWGCTVMPLLGDTTLAVQPQVSLTWGHAHTCAAPGAAPGGDMYIAVYIAVYVAVSAYS